jgi:hypothetical protein
MFDFTITVRNNRARTGTFSTPARTGMNPRAIVTKPTKVGWRAASPL